MKLYLLVFFGSLISFEAFGLPTLIKDIYVTQSPDFQHTLTLVGSEDNCFDEQPQIEIDHDLKLINLTFNTPAPLPCIDKSMGFPYLQLGLDDIMFGKYLIQVISEENLVFQKTLDFDYSNTGSVKDSFLLSIET